MERLIEPRDIELLKFNYEKLHQSIWDSHKTSWTVSSIFLTATFALQGFVVKDYFSGKGEHPFQVVLAAIIIEVLSLTWWSIMFCFRAYNKFRLYRLKEIENILFNNKIDDSTYLLRQYNYPYSCFPFPRSSVQKLEKSAVLDKSTKSAGVKPLIVEMENDMKSISRGENPKKLSNTAEKSKKLGFHDIYTYILSLITLINLLLIITAYLKIY